MKHVYCVVFGYFKRAISSFLLFPCPVKSTCAAIGLSVGASLSGLASVGLVDCDADATVCQRLRDMVPLKQDDGEEAANLLYFPDRVVGGEGERLSASVTDQVEMARAVLDKLPGPARLDGTAFQVGP